MTRRWLFELLLLESLVQQSCSSLLFDRTRHMRHRQLQLDRHDDPPDDRFIAPFVTGGPVVSAPVAAPIDQPTLDEDESDPSSPVSSPDTDDNLVEPTGDIEDEVTPEPSSPVSSPAAAAPSETTDGTTEPTVVVTDEETTISPASSPVLVDPEDTNPPSEGSGDNDVSAPSAPVSSPELEDNDVSAPSAPVSSPEFDDNDVSAPSAPVSSPLVAEDTAQPSAGIEDEEILQPSAPVSPLVTADPSGATDGTTEPTVVIMDEVTSIPDPPSPASSPVSVDPEDTTPPSEEFGGNDNGAPTAPVSSPLATAETAAMSESATKTDGIVETAAAAVSSQWRTSRGAILVENGLSLFSSALSGDGFTIAMEYKDKQDNARVQAHRFGSDGSWMRLGTEITGIGHLGGASNRLALSADGKILAVGFPVENCQTESMCGLVRVFTYEADDWKQLGNDIAGESSFGYLGLTVDLSDDGMTMAAGAPFSHGASGNHVGKVRVFRYDTAGDIWEQLGDDLEGDASWDYAGHGVALSADGTIVAYGALQNVAGGIGYVKVFAYDKTDDRFVQLGEKLEGGDGKSKLGSAVSLSSDGSTLVVGAVKEGGADDEVDFSSFGLVSVYQHENGAWVKIGDDIHSGSTGDLFGFSVAMSADGNRVVIGAPEDDYRLGSVSVFDLNDGRWTLQGQSLEYTNAGVGGVPYELGRSVGISSSGLVVSAGGWFGVEIFEDSFSRASKLDFGSMGSSHISSLTSGIVMGSPTIALPTGYPTSASMASPSMTIYGAPAADEITRKREPRSDLYN